MSISEENPGAEGDGVLRRRRRRRWSETQKRQIVAETQEPGVSVPMVAQRYNLNANQVFWWRRLFREPERAGGAGRFVPVVVEGYASGVDSRLRGQGLLPFGLPVPGEEFMQTGLRQVGDAVEDVGEPGLRVDVVELRGADESVHHRHPLAAAIGAGEEP